MAKFRNGPTVQDSGNTSWMLSATAFILLMITGLGFFYSGMSRSKNALSMLMLCALSLAIVTVEWFVIGYTLALSSTGSPFIGDFKWVGLRNVNWEPNPVSPTVPGSVFAINHCMYAAITPALALGSPAERLRLMPACIFILLFSIIAYNPVAYWTWGHNGWARTLGALDFAGGGPVHMASGFAALAYAIALGERRGFLTEVFRPNSYSNILLGTALMWFGWFGFNGSAGDAANPLAGSAVLATHISASMGAVTWTSLNYFYHRKFSSFGFCSGAVVGLVAITPGAGYVDPWAALIYGALAALCSHYAVELKHRLRYDDALDVFAVHGVGGLIGNILTGIFANKRLSNPNNIGPNVEVLGDFSQGGWINGNWKQVPYQLASSTAIGAWTFVISLILLKVINAFCPLRIDEEGELLGIDYAELGEYHNDLAASSAFGFGPSIAPSSGVGMGLANAGGSGLNRNTAPPSATIAAAAAAAVASEEWGTSDSAATSIVMDNLPTKV
ncbi:ammonium transporter [Ramicandelaber brevisporus]|nr:ammonium transporter [Ramicandelaber brevisporus]